MGKYAKGERGFTLIELSIVLVIIGLIVGGVLVGQNLISAAAVRAQVTQIEKFNTAVYTFREKYGYLPGDIKDPDASNFGFAPRGPLAGEGDGNGVIEGNPGSGNSGFKECSGETWMFWEDLSTAHLIEGTFNSASSTGLPSNNNNMPALLAWFPSAKINSNNLIYVYSTGGVNYYSLAAASFLGSGGTIWASPGLTVAQAAGIDKKMDDGNPQTGNVQANYMAFNAIQAVGPLDTSATSGSSTTCYDNGNVAGATQKYSVEISNGSNLNCALSFRFQ